MDMMYNPYKKEWHQENYYLQARRPLWLSDFVAELLQKTQLGTDRSIE